MFDGVSEFSVWDVLCRRDGVVMLEGMILCLGVLDGVCGRLLVQACALHLTLFHQSLALFLPIDAFFLLLVSVGRRH